MLIEVKETHSPKAVNRSGTVVTMDGQKLDCWQPLFSTIQIGKRYDVVTVTNDRGYVTIKKATLVEGAASVPANQNASPFSSPVSGEGEFVGHVIAALISTGKMPDERMGAYVARLRRLWRETDPAAQQYDQAAE